ncbi:MAG: hypothetical protein NC900_00585 [Candidatus Omnitrophica bacterium]|nr:hypothetical protein [Candidatus Omnitrophota bacterium]
MRLFRFLTLCFFITLLALIYTHQQIKIFYLAYNNEKKAALLDKLIDNNNLLRYNLAVFSSLPYIEKKLSNKFNNFEIASNTRSLKALSLNVTSNELKENKQNIFSRFINLITKQAEAKPINP